MGRFGDRRGRMSNLSSGQSIDKIAHIPRKMFDLRQGLKLHTSMSFRATALKRSHLIGLVLVLISGPLFGQAATSPVAFVNQEAIVTSFVPAPNLGGTNGSSSSDSQWLKVEFHYG